MHIPTEPIGSIPRPAELLDGLRDHAAGRLDEAALETLYDRAVRDTVSRFEATGSPVLTDGEQRKASFVTYPLAGLENLSSEGVEIGFADGHARRLPCLTSGPFRYGVHAASYLEAARPLTQSPLKQAVISPSALSLLYPADGLPDYPRETFLDDLVDAAEADIRGCLDAGADNVQIDFTEGRLAVKLDPSKGLLRDFVALNNRVLERFDAAERARIGVHTCPGGDCDSTHSADVPYLELLPDLFELKAGRFYLQMASERDRNPVLEAVRDHAPADAVLFIGVIDPIDPRVERPEEVRDRVIQAARFLPVERLGTTDDCGFSPFGDDTSTARDIAFAKIQARVEGTEMARRYLGGESLNEPEPE